MEEFFNLYFVLFIPFFLFFLKKRKKNNKYNVQKKSVKCLHIVCKVYIISTSPGNQNLDLGVANDLLFEPQDQTPFNHTPKSLFEPSFKACFGVHLSEFCKNLLDSPSPRKTTLKRQKG